MTADRQHSTIARRTMLHAAWTTPVIIGAASVPAFAGSQPPVMKLPRVVTVDLSGNPVYTPAAAQTGVSSVSVGTLGIYALRPDGSVVAWTPEGSDIILPDDFDHLKSIDSVLGTRSYTLAVKTDGTVVGDNPLANAHEDLIDKSGMETISTGAFWAAGVTNEGMVLAGGGSDVGGEYENAWVPDNLDHVVQVVTGSSEVLALKDDGTVVYWDNYGLQSVPDAVRDVTQIANGDVRCHAALLRDGRVLFWSDGEQEYGGTEPAVDATVLAHDAAQVAVSEIRNISLVVFVLGLNGTVTAYNMRTGEETTVAAMTGASSISAKYGYAAAIIPAAPTP